MQAKIEAEKWAGTRAGYITTRYLRWNMPTLEEFRARLIRDISMKNIGKRTGLGIITQIAEDLWIPINTEEGPTWGAHRTTWVELDEAWQERCTCRTHRTVEEPWPEEEFDEHTTEDQRRESRALVCTQCGGRRQRTRRLRTPEADQCEWCGRTTHIRCEGCGAGVHVVGECTHTRVWGQTPVVGANINYTNMQSGYRRCPDCAAQWAQEWHEYNGYKSTSKYWEKAYRKKVELAISTCQPGAGHSSARVIPQSTEIFMEDAQTVKRLLSSGEWMDIKTLLEAFRREEADAYTNERQSKKRVGHVLATLRKARRGRTAKVEVDNKTKQVRMIVMTREKRQTQPEPVPEWVELAAAQATKEGRARASSQEDAEGEQSLDDIIAAEDFELEHQELGP